MELTELINRVDELRARARALELCLTRTERHDVVLKGGKPAHETEREATLTVRTWLDEGRTGEATGAPEALGALLDEALAAAGEADPDPLQGPVARQERELGGLGIDDRRRAQVEASHRESVLTGAWQTVRKASKLTPRDFAYRDARTVRRYVNSRGVALEEAGTTFAVRGSAVAQSPDGDFVLSERIASRRFSTVATLPLGEFLVRRAAAVRQPGETLEPGPVRVVLTPRATAQLFEHLGAAFTAARMAAGDFFLGDPAVALDPRLHLLDDGLLVGGLRTRAFDDRGVAPVALTLLRDGRPDGRFLSVEEARRHEVRPTGHWLGGRLAPSNLVLKSGTRSVNALLAELRGPSLRVDDLPDLSGVDLVTGAARLPVHGEVMDANKAVGAMRHVVIEGSLLEILGELVEVCNDTDRWGAVDAPALITQGWTLSSST